LFTFGGEKHICKETKEEWRSTQKLNKEIDTEKTKKVLSVITATATVRERKVAIKSKQKRDIERTE
jgi:hypothetical protein